MAVLAMYETAVPKWNIPAVYTAILSKCLKNEPIVNEIFPLLPTFLREW
jgi:hypothetical protein